MRAFLPLLGLACLSAAAGQDARPGPPPPGAPPEAVALRARLEAVVRDAIEHPRSVGLSVAVAGGDELLLAGGFGLAEVEHGVPADVDTVFRIGSITKQFTAALVMGRVERGEIELDGDMRRYLADYPEGEHVVTVRHLLTHTSGIPSYTGLGPTWRRTVPLELTHDELLGLFRDLPFEFAPGERFAYNNSGYFLLGVLLERVTGTPYDRLVAEELCRPLGLARTRYGSNADVIPNRAQGYRFVDGELANDELIGMSQPGAAGALLSTARDLVRWQRALVEGEVVSAASYERMTTPCTLNDGATSRYGFGLSVDDFEGERRVQHGGGINGFNSVLWYLPEARLSVAVISNCEGYRSETVAARLARVALGLEEPEAAGDGR